MGRCLVGIAFIDGKVLANGSSLYENTFLLLTLICELWMATTISHLAGGHYLSEYIWYMCDGHNAWFTSAGLDGGPPHRSVFMLDTRPLVGEGCVTGVYK